MKFTLYFLLLACALGVIFKKLLPNPRPQIFILMSSSKSSIVLTLIFRSWTDFELTFVYGVR